MEASGLFNSPVPVMQAAEVARLGYAALKAGRPVVVAGLLIKSSPCPRVARRHWRYW